MRLRTLFTLLFMASLTIYLFWFTRLPLGITGEWTWQRLPFVAVEMLPALIVSAIAFCIYLLVALIALSRIKYCSRWELSIWLFALTSSGIIWSLLLQDSPPAEYRLSKAPFILYYEGSSGYFTEANEEISDVRQYLVNYEVKMKQGDVLHEGTHPPGLPLFYLALIELCNQAPGLQTLLLNTQPSSFQEAMQTIAEITTLSRHPLSQSGAAVLWLATILTLVMSSLTVIPLFLLSKEFTSREISWQVATLWPLVPAALIFQPKSDALYSMISILFLYLWIVAWRHNSRLLYILAGFILWTGLLLSLAFLPVALCAVLYCIFETWRLRSDKTHQYSAIKHFLSAGFFGLLGLTIPTALMSRFFELNLLNVWILNFQNHAGFYLQYPRTYWKWLLINPIEISLALGLPISWLVFKSLLNRKRFRNIRQTAPCLSCFNNLLFSCVLVLGLLWLSGKNMGEVARLWLIFLPWFLVMTIPYWQSIETETHFTNSNLSSYLKLQSVWIVVLAAQAIACIATVNRITGFHFPPG